VLTDREHGAFAEGVEQADGVGLAGELPDVGLVGPAEGGYLVVGGQVAAGDLAAEARAAQALPPSVLSYVAGGAGDESTQRANVAAFARWGLIPRMLVSATRRCPA
jgi:FMN-dependent dehydrogenase